AERDAGRGVGGRRLRAADARPVAAGGGEGVVSRFRVQVCVMPRAALLDPLGRAVEHALRARGFGEVGRVRVGKHLVLEVTAATHEEAMAQARTMCDRLLANPVTEDYELAVETTR